MGKQRLPQISGRKPILQTFSIRSIVLLVTVHLLAGLHFWYADASDRNPATAGQRHDSTFMDAELFAFISDRFLLRAQSNSESSEPVEPNYSACIDQSEAEALTCFANHYAAADRRLNQVYQNVLGRIAAAERNDLIADQRQWIGYRDYICSFQPGPLDPDALMKCLIDRVQDRSVYIEAAWTGDGVAPGVAGVYADGYGGYLELEPRSGDSWNFHFEVVRGPTYHIGELHGALDQPQGVFEWNLHGEQELTAAEQAVEPDCELEFSFNTRVIEVKEIDCSHFRGARAYFDGSYRKIK